MSAKSYTLKRTEPVSHSSSIIDYKSELNESQYEAVTTTSGPILCIAGAGSGKTRTLVYRVAYLIEQGIPPENILLLTFTRKAAQEMMKRASNILDDRCRRIRGGTFHGFANMILRRFHKEAELPANFSIIDRSDSEDLLNLIRTEQGLAKSDKRFPKKNTIIDIFSKSVNTNKDIRTVIEEEYPQFEEYYSVIESLQEAYQKSKRSRGVLDYDDLLVELSMLLSCSEKARATLSGECRYIMIDEYQDTNHIQAQIGLQLAHTHNNILAVGDDAQSIYSFRGANFKNIMNFPSFFDSCKIITLEQNYRSTEPILTFANALLDSAEEKYPKKLFSTKTSDQKPVFIRPISVDDQAQFIAQRSLELREEGVPLDKIAVLFRAAWHSNELEVELNSRNIPFVKYGGIRFIDTAHVKDITSLLKVSCNPADIISWHRSLLMLEGLGPKNARTIAGELNSPENWSHVISKYSKKKFGSQLAHLVEEVEHIQKTHDNPGQCLEKISTYYFPFLKKIHDDYTRRIDDINSLMSMSERYTSLQSFLDDLTLEAPDQSQTEAEGASMDEESMTLSTIHSAKGLEWHTVFIINLIDGHLPSARSLHTREDIEEERRLLYVASTRAMDNLYLLCPEHNRTRGFNPIGPGLQFSEPSRFLADMHDFNELVETWSLDSEEAIW